MQLLGKWCQNQNLPNLYTKLINIVVKLSFEIYIYNTINNPTIIMQASYYTSNKCYKHLNLLHFQHLYIWNILAVCICFVNTSILKVCQMYKYKY